MQTAPPPAGPVVDPALPAPAPAADPLPTAAGAPPLPAWVVPSPPYRQAAPVPLEWPVRRGALPAPLRSKELAAAFAIILTCDAALYGRSHGLAPGGFGLALFFFLVPLALAVAARSWRMSARLGVIAALLGAVVARCVFDPTPGTVLSGVVLLAAFTFSLRARRMFVPESLVSMLSGVQKLPTRIGAAFAGARKIAARTRIGNVSVLPIVVPVALCAAFGGVFALANPVVAHGLGVAWKAITSVVELPTPVRIFLWVASFAGACALLRPTCRLAQGSEAAKAEGDATPRSLLVARNALGALNVLFLLYNVLDAAYLWSGAPPAGMPTQQYAHEGAFWLTLALVMVTGVLGVMFRGALAHDARAKLARTMAYVWMGQGLVLALGTYRRIAIHIGHSGLSDLRIVGILGTTLVVAGVVTVAVKLRHRRTFTWLVRRQLDAFVLTLMVYAVFPTHLVSARVNVARIEAGEYTPLLHMFRQSTQPESAATLVPLLRHPDVRVRQGVAALLDAERETLAAEIARQGSWREHDLASRRALAALEAAAPLVTTTLGTVDHGEARQVLLKMSRAANEDWSLEELLTIERAADRMENAPSSGPDTRY